MDLKERLNKIKDDLTKKRNLSKAKSLDIKLFDDELDTIDDSIVKREFAIGKTMQTSSSIALAKYLRSKKDEALYLEYKVDEFIKWYYINCIEGNYTDVDEYQMPKKMRNFIEKMAVWFELRYPDYEINRLMPGLLQEDIDVSDVMFNENMYINDQLDGEAEVRVLDWVNFYNTEVFINSLPYEERIYFNDSKYSDVVYFDLGNSAANLRLNQNGIVEMSELHCLFDKYGIKDENLVGMHIKDVLNLFKEKNIQLPKDNELEKMVKRVDINARCKEEMLNCVMYRIIERGGNRIGPRRAFLFAREFDRNIDIPMMYAVDYSDPGLRRFMNEYIKAGGSKDLECLIEYFSRTSDTEKLDRVSINELILTLNNDASTFYTPEEEELHQRLVNVLSNQIARDIPKKEGIKQLRLQRKLGKY